MKLDFFDSNLYIGRPSEKHDFKPIRTIEELDEITEAKGIKKALLWHIIQYGGSPVKGNELLAKLLKNKENYWGTWTILPPQTNEVIKENFFNNMKENRIVALRAFPEQQNFLLNKIVFGEFLEEVSERQIPLILSLMKGNNWANIYKLMEEYPELTCIISDIGIWGVDRYTWPLLENFPNVYLETSLLSLEAGGLEATVNRFGAEKLLFGTGFPERYSEAPMLQLQHSEIDLEDKQKIATKNLEDLLVNIKL